MSSKSSPDTTIVVLTAPSGAGKTTIAQAALQKIDNLKFSVSATTRPRRSHEIDGVHYHFVSPEQFQDLVDKDALLEYEEVYQNRYYGTLWSEVEKSTPENPVLLDIDVLGASRVKNRFEQQALVVFIEPPSLETLRERLVERRTEDPESLDQRLSRAKMEISMAGRFDYVVINDDVERAADETVGYIESFLNERRSEFRESEPGEGNGTGAHSLEEGSTD